MKIIIAPSKKQLHVTENLADFNPTSKIQELQKILSKMNRLEIGKLMKIKNDLLDTVYEDIQDFGKNNARCIDVYQGVVYAELDLVSYSKSQQDYMNERLRIISALYGVLSPESIISPYRLDMTMKPANINLYDFWNETIVNAFKDESIIVSLASKEFEKLLNPIKQNVIQINFKHRIPAFKLKKLRGQMLNQIIKSEIHSVNDIKTLEVDGFIYSKELSSPNEFVFVK